MFNFRRCVGIALAFVADAVQQGSSWVRFPQTFMRRWQERNQAATILTVRELARISHLPSPCASSRFDLRQTLFQSAGALFRLWLPQKQAAHTHCQQQHTPSQYAFGPMVDFCSQDAAHWWKRCVWKGRGGRIRSGSGREKGGKRERTTLSTRSRKVVAQKEEEEYVDEHCMIISRSFHDEFMMIFQEIFTTFSSSNFSWWEQADNYFMIIWPMIISRKIVEATIGR